MKKTRRKDIVTCPKCSEEFSLTYSRTVACASNRGGNRPCKYAPLGNCGYIRCPKCDHEWPNPNWPSWAGRKKYEPGF